MLCVPLWLAPVAASKRIPVAEQRFHLQSGFTLAAEKVSPPPLPSSAHFLQTSLPPSGFSSGFAVPRNDPTKELVGHQRQHITLSGLLLVTSAVTWREASWDPKRSEPLLLEGRLSQMCRQRPRHLLACLGLSESTIALQCPVPGGGRQSLSYD